MESSAPATGPRVLVIDRQALVVHALSRLLTSAPLCANVQTATRSDQVVAFVRRENIQLVCCDVGAKPITGAQLTRELLLAEADVRVILLGEPDDAELLIGALESGASGFFTKDASPEEFLDGVEAVLAGHFAVGHSLAPRTMARLAGKGLSEPPEAGRLSASQRAILVMVGNAQSISAIATARQISQKTVRNHLTNIYRKLELRNRTEAVLWAARTGLTDASQETQD